MRSFHSLSQHCLCLGCSLLVVCFFLIGIYSFGCPFLKGRGDLLVLGERRLQLLEAAEPLPHTQCDRTVKVLRTELSKTTKALESCKDIQNKEVVRAVAYDHIGNGVCVDYNGQRTPYCQKDGVPPEECKDTCSKLTACRAYQVYSEDRSRPPSCILNLRTSKAPARYECHYQDVGHSDGIHFVDGETKANCYKKHIETSSKAANVRLTCAPEVLPHNRVVVAVAEHFALKTGSSGETYVLAGIVDAFEDFGFIISVAKRIDNSSLTLLQRAHRILTGGPESMDCDFVRMHPELGCKIFIMRFWFDVATEDLGPQYCGLRAEQIITPWPSRFSTFIGMKAKIPIDSSPTSLPRGKVGFILGKGWGYFDSRKGGLPAQAMRAIQSLIQHGFELHSTCSDEKCNLPAEVKRYKYMAWASYKELLVRCSFVLGVGDPADSPTPLEALQSGAAFLNPKARHVFYGKVYEYQHSTLKSLGMPYVYNVDLGDTDQVVAAAHSAVRHRFASFVPWEYRQASFMDRVCSLLLEDDQVCICARDPAGCKVWKPDNP